MSSAPTGSSTHTAAPLTGAYVEVSQLLALRLTSRAQRATRQRRLPPSGGDRSTRLRGRGVDFAEVRAYGPGDDVRNIDWRVTARMNEPHTKVFREERERPTLVCVDQTRTQFFGSRVRLKSVAAAEAAAHCAWQALAEGDRVGGLILGNNRSSWHKPRRASRAVARMLGDLAGYNQALHRDLPMPDEDFLAAELKQLGALARTGHRIVFLSDFLPSAAFWGEGLKRLARHNDVIAVHLSDPLERALTVTDPFTVAIGEQRQEVDGSRAAVRERYRQRAGERQQALRETLLRSGVRFVSLSSERADRVPGF